MNYFKIIVFLWNIFPFKKTGKQLIRKSKYFQKFYRDLRFKGKMTVPLQDKTIILYNPGFTTIENELFWNDFESWEKVSVNIWQRLCQDAKCILDIGANSGVYSFIAAAVRQDAEIFSYEPVSRTIELFQKNLELNPKSKITLIKKAVSNKNGISLFFDLPTTSQYSASLNADFYKDVPNTINYEVKTVKLDTEEYLQNKKIDLIKIDVETHEAEAIEGMIGIINKNKPTMLIEILNDEVGEKIERLIYGLGYIYFNIDEVNSPIKVEKLTKTHHFNFLICQESIAHKLNLL